MNVKSVIFVGFLLVGVILLMGLKDETHPKWQYGRLEIVNNFHGTLGASRVTFLAPGRECDYIYASESSSLNGDGGMSVKQLVAGEPSSRRERREKGNLESTHQFLREMGFSNWKQKWSLNPTVVYGHGVTLLMNGLGRQGWELVSTEYREDSSFVNLPVGDRRMYEILIYTYTFKRRIQ